MTKYHVGQVLHLLPSRGSSSRAPGQCTILSVLPDEGRLPRYRVQLHGEKNERIADHADLLLQSPTNT